MASNGNIDGANLQQQVELLKQRLAQAQKLTALGELVSTTTHEFNNVLMTIINYAKMGMRHRDAATRDKCFEKILGASDRATKITNTVLGMARNRSAGQEPTDLVRLVEDTLVLLEREMNKYRVTVEKQFQAVPQAYVNGNQIQQVLLNLLINAADAMASFDAPRDLVVRSELASAQDVTVSVADRGPGSRSGRNRRQLLRAAGHS